MAFPTPGETFTGKVVAEVPFGSFIEHPSGHHGLLHGEPLPVGTELHVKVLSTDPDAERFSVAKA
ncbi:hypothetical protein [Actinokineospora bangkokensis]|uniref:S1 motif domain-containing protein n=1 Tax=Actinokineospora bangkokensis TaxID=1193682 RepID=A0A1Q9LR83_9PSEU|nr:hypothetical protein [Actinokineospora bangkokensis]OLR94535.1 hypothetical protein BJP25_12400 [Actinokineospora bangkokensis]